MPQLWLTYRELADELGCGSDEARTTAIQRRWTRRRSRDGLTRVLMPADLMAAYVTRAAGLAASTDAMVAALRAMLKAMSPALSPAEAGADGRPAALSALPYLAGQSR